MTYLATVCKLTNLKKHPNGDYLQIGLALGYNVIVGLDVDEDTLGIVFPSDGKLSHGILSANSLYRKDPITGELSKGFFEPSGRVKSLKLRGAMSEAFWTPLTALSFAGDIKSLEKEYLKACKNGELLQIDSFNGILLCEKYYTSATLKQMNSLQGQSKKKGKRAEDYAKGFERHGDTTQLRDAVSFLVGQNLTATVSCKLHGTSGRTGLVQWTKRSWFQNILSKFGLYKDKHRYVTGTRKVVLEPDNMNKPETGFYAGTTFRTKIHNMIMEIGLKENEILYYEIVGFDENGTGIMSTHSLDKKSLKETGIPEKELAQYGSNMVYSYGCEPKEYKVFLYRIVQEGKDLSWLQMTERCKELELKTVPYLATLEIKESDTAEDIMKQVEFLTRGNSVLDERHIKEGVCLRFDLETGLRVYKYKGFVFCALEGIRKNSDEYIDFEEAS